MGRMRFVADVPRGLACGCVCPSCGAALVARQGHEKEWHFAHEQSQERPECRVGALNLLRRLVAEEFVANGRFIPQPYSCPHPVGLRPALVWNERAVSPARALPFDSQHAPLAEVDLERGGTALVHVVIGKEAPPAPARAQPEALVWCPEPPVGLLRTEDQARTFARENLQVSWLWLPDTRGLLAAAQREAELLQQRLEQAAAARASAAGARWAVKRRDLLSAAPHDLPADPAASPTPPSGPPTWAPGWLPGTSFHYRRLDDGTQWVAYRIAGNSWRLAPVPKGFEGWDETFPPSIARPGDGTWLEVASFDRLLGLLQVHSKASRVDSDPRAIEAEFSRSTPAPHASPDA